MIRSHEKDGAARSAVRIDLVPLGKSLDVEPGTRLQDCLFPFGVEFPCGGRGRCRGCRVKVLEGRLPVTPEEEKILAAAELAAGWRLACRAAADGPLRLEVAQWETSILSDDSPFDFTPSEGLGIAVDLGTTTLVAQILDLSTGSVLGVRTALNPQARFGGDVMSRVQLAVAGKRRRVLESIIRREVGRLAVRLLEEVHGAGPLREVVIAGNTVMHHLFCGIDLEPLSRCPFEPVRDGLEVFRASELGWKLEHDPTVRFLPCLGGFVGSDILAGIVAARLHERSALNVLVDLGTNGEIVVGNAERLLCASTAAGPAFEGARISMGMRAATGAIARVGLERGGFERGGLERREVRCDVLGGVAPRGICGSGLVDAAAVGLELGTILPSGRIASGEKSWMLAPPVAITQHDLRELQLAKGAIAAGMRRLLEHWGARPEDVERVYLAGAFGNYIDRSSARRIGLVDFPEGRVDQAGNTALLGAKIALSRIAAGKDGSGAGEDGLDAIREKTRHVSLGSDERFQEVFIEEMSFPAAG